MPDLPTGIVTFLFTDIEGSTELVRALGDRYPALHAEGEQLSVAQARQLVEELEPAPDAPPLPTSDPPGAGS